MASGAHIERLAEGKTVLFSIAPFPFIESSEQPTSLDRDPRKRRSDRSKLLFPQAHHVKSRDKESIKVKKYTESNFRSSALISVDVQRDTLDGQPLEIPGTSAARPPDADKFRLPVTRSVDLNSRKDIYDRV